MGRIEGFWGNLEGRGPRGQNWFFGHQKRALGALHIRRSGAAFDAARLLDRPLLPLGESGRPPGDLRPTFPQPLARARPPIVSSSQAPPSPRDTDESISLTGPWRCLPMPSISPGHRPLPGANFGSGKWRSSASDRAQKAGILPIRSIARVSLRRLSAVRFSGYADGSRRCLSPSDIQARPARDANAAPAESAGWRFIARIETARRRQPPRTR